MEEVSLAWGFERMDGSSNNGAAETPSLKWDLVEGGGN